MKKLIFLSSFIYTLCSSYVVAEDIEIYVGTNEQNANQANVLLMVDTSGSMDEIVTGTSETRLQQTKRALKEMLTKLPDNTNVGLGRYNDPGGSILYPVSKLSADTNNKMIKTITTSENDAYQEYNGTMYTNTNYLNFISGLRTVTSRVATGNDDSEQCYTGGLFSMTSSYIDINTDSGCSSMVNGILFKNLNIPKNSKIVSANAVFKVASTSYGDADTEFFVENKSFPSDYANSAGNRVIDRNYLSSPTVLWAPVTAAWSILGPSITSPDLTPLIQTLVNKSDWTTSSFVNLMFKLPTGGRTGTKFSLYTYNYSSSFAPYMTLSYYDSVTSKNNIGLKFEDIQIPSGAHIKSAVLKMKASANNGSGQVRIRTESSNNVASYSSSNTITSRALSGSSSTIDYTNWIADSYSQFDVTSLIQDKVNGTWCGGDSIGFVLDSFDSFQAYSFDSGSANAPTLELEFDTVPNNACARANLVNQITQTGDDGNQRSNGNMYLNYDTIQASSTYPYIGLHFRNVKMDSKTITNLNIEDAYLEFTSSESTSGSTSLRITAEKVVDAPLLNNTKNSLSTKTKTTAYVDWSITNNFSSDTVYRTPNLSAIVQEIMAQSSWKAGNSINFIIQRNSGARSFIANDYSVSKSPKLIIKYKGNGSYTSVTVRDHLSNLIDALPAEGSTPLEGALYESAQYFLGKSVDYGRSRNGTSYAATKRISEDNTYTGGTRVLPNGCSLSNLGSSACTGEYISGRPVYTSPMTQSTCEVNSLIMITDGYPNSYSNYTSNLKNMDGTPLATQINRLTGSSCRDPWSCASTVAKYIYETDFNAERGGKQNVFTHMIGFSELDSEGKLTDLARKGGGMFLPANNNQELVYALTRIFNNILDVNTTLASPGIAVNQNNRLENLSDIYYSVFKPSLRKTWYGNLKKYKIDANTVQIVDANGSPAIDVDTGFFKSGSKSFWSVNPDGADASTGGAASMLTLPRKVFTYTGASAPSNSSLNTAANTFTESNTALTRSLFGLDSSIDDTEFSDFLKWGRGVDVNDEDRDNSVTDVKPFLGDPLHSRPILINYKQDDDVIYYSTNTGYLHAVDAATGQERFSFIPKEMLSNLYTHYLDEPGRKIYGLDASWIALRHDEDQDGEIKSTGDYINLYGGMRMGGRNYYALDVTNVSAASPSPKLKWVITPNTNVAFNDMGQTWSEPVITKIKLNGVEKIVLVFAGGYDPAYEDSSYNGATDSLGKQLYMVDANTGALIWWASGAGTTANTKVTGMNYSIPAKPTVMDLNNDTYADVIYIGDLGGQVFKFNINNNNTGAANLATGKIIAKLGVSDTTVSGVENRRKIYEPVTATRVKRNNEKYMALIVGTGYRSRPLNKQINDTIAVIKDKEDYYSTNPVLFTTPLKMNDLYDVTTQFNPDTLLKQTALSSGFKILMKETNGVFTGEKILSEQIVYDNKIIFSTYIPDGYSTRCYPIEGFSRSYQISLFDGSPSDSSNIENPASQTQTDRYSKDVLPGISAGAKIIYTEDKVIQLVNTKAKELGNGGDLGLKRLKWSKETSDE